jgi:DNA-binding MarR family transcriptional regulator
MLTFALIAARLPGSAQTVVPELDSSTDIVIHPSTADECVKTARSMMYERAHRARFFDGSLLSEPGWDILLELFIAHADQKRLNISAVGAACGIPSTTTLRWLNLLMQLGFAERSDDPLDARRAFVNITAEGAITMMNYIRDLRSIRI